MWIPVKVQEPSVEKILSAIVADASRIGANADGSRIETLMKIQHLIPIMFLVAFCTVSALQRGKCMQMIDDRSNSLNIMPKSRP